MNTLSIYTYPNNILNKKANCIKKVDNEITKLVENMAYTMYNSNGIGLAATQVGILKRILVYSVNKNNRTSFGTIINPEIVKKKKIIISKNEGCLSIPGVTLNVKRFGEISVKGKDLNEKTLLIHTRGILSIVLQHEIDHLNGVLFVERVSYIKQFFYKNY